MYTYAPGGLDSTRNRRSTHPVRSARMPAANTMRRAIRSPRVGTGRIPSQTRLRQGQGGQVRDEAGGYEGLVKFKAATQGRQRDHLVAGLNAVVSCCATTTISSPPRKAAKSVTGRGQ